MSFEEQIEQTIPATFYMLSAVDEEAQVLDAFELPDPEGKAGGPCTSALLQSLYRDEDDEEEEYTWAQTLELMREKIDEIGLAQLPQLSSSRPIDVEEPLYIVPPDCEGTKRAILIGVNYVEHPHGLTGCHHDVRNMKDFLIDVYGFERENMLILADDDMHHAPNKKIIIDGLRRLTEISKPGDVIFVHFSGHGAQLAGEEEEVLDEILFPADFEDSGPITDDEIYHLFTTKVQDGVHVVAVIDCCHAGTAMDLPYVCNVGDEEISRRDGFKMREGGIADAPTKKGKKKKKDKDSSSKRKSTKKKKPKPESEDEPEPEPEPEKKKKKKKFGFGKKKK